MAREAVIEMDRLGIIQARSGEVELWHEGSWLLRAFREQLPSHRPGPLLLLGQGRLTYDRAVDFSLSDGWNQFSEWFFNYEEAVKRTPPGRDLEEQAHLRRVLAACGTPSWTEFKPHLQNMVWQVARKAPWDEVVGSLPTAMRDYFRPKFLWRFQIALMSRVFPSETLQEIVREYYRYYATSSYQLPDHWDYVIEVYFTRRARGHIALERARYCRAEAQDWQPIIIYIL